LSKIQSCIVRFVSFKQIILSIEQIAQIFSISEISVFRLVESKQIHSIETAQGKRRICGNSASNYSMIRGENYEKEKL
jgi:hypothetical protein